jgi:hypothetical protein
MSGRATGAGNGDRVGADRSAWINLRASAAPATTAAQGGSDHGSRGHQQELSSPATRWPAKNEQSRYTQPSEEAEPSYQSRMFCRCFRKSMRRGGLDCELREPRAGTDGGAKLHVDSAGKPEHDPEVKFRVPL